MLTQVTNKDEEREPMAATIHDSLEPLATSAFGRMYILHTRLSAVECQDRLNVCLTHRRLLKRRLRGRVSQRRFALACVGGRNDFRPTAVGRLSESASGTDITIRMHTMRLVYLISAVAFVVLVAWVGLAAYHLVRFPGYIEALFAFDMIILAGYGLCRWSARGEEAYLLSVLCQVLDVHFDEE